MTKVLTLLMMLALCGCASYTETVTHIVNDTGERQIVTEWRAHGWGMKPKEWSPERGYTPTPRPKRNFPGA